MSNRKAHFFKQSGGAFSPLDLNPVVYIRGWEGVNESGGNVSSIDDLTGNGYNFTGVNTPTIEANGINGLQSIRFDGSSYLNNLDAITQITDLRFYWIDSIEIEVANSGNPYHNIMIMGVSTFTTPGATFAHLYNPNTSLNFINNSPNNALDSIINQTQLTPKYAIIDKKPNDLEYTLNGVSTSKTGSVDTSNQNIYIGNWANRGAKMLFSEFGVLKDNPTAQEVTDLKQYFTDTYNL